MCYNSVWMRHIIDNFLQGSWDIITPEASWILLHLIPGAEGIITVNFFGHCAAITYQIHHFSLLHDIVLPWNKLIITQIQVGSVRKYVLYFYYKTHKPAHVSCDRWAGLSVINPRAILHEGFIEIETSVVTMRNVI